MGTDAERGTMWGLMMLVPLAQGLMEAGEEGRRKHGFPPSWVWGEEELEEMNE